ncbi:MAG: hypothetical protein ACYCSG_05420 [Thermoplasmataceae archaeon]
MIEEKHYELAIFQPEDFFPAIESNLLFPGICKYTIRLNRYLELPALYPYSAVTGKG